MDRVGDGGERIRVVETKLKGSLDKVECREKRERGDSQKNRVAESHSGTAGSVDHKKVA